MSNSVDEKAFKAVLDGFKTPCTEGEEKAMRLFATSYETAKQPVRVSVYEACKEYMRVTHPGWNPDQSLFVNGNPIWELYADGIKSVLSVVKDAAKEQGVDVVYE